MSDNIRIDSALSAANEDNKGQSCESSKQETNEKFKDNNEVAAANSNGEDKAIDNLLDAIIDPKSKDPTNNSADNAILLVNGAQNNEEPNMTTNNVEVLSKESESKPMTEKNNQTNATANSSLSLLAQYDSHDSSSSSSSESSSDTESSGMEVDSADSESSVSSVKSEKSLGAIKKKLDEFQDAEEDDEDEGEGNKGRVPIKAIGELGIEDLPPIEDLYITVPEKECNSLGKITSIVDQLVLVESLPNVVPLDLDTVLFLDKGQRPLGKIFDVMGQIHCPIYCVRFNSNQEILDKGIQVGQEVYCAPSAPCTTFVILPELMKQKGSDASWKNDIEPPARFIEYSDDEQEKNATRMSKRNGRDPTQHMPPSEEHYIPPRNGHPGNHTYHRARRGGGNANRENSHHSSFNYPRPNHHHMPMANHMHHQPQYYYPPPGSSSTIYPNPFAQPDPRYYANPFAYAPTVNYPPFNPNLFNGPPPPPPPPQN